MRRTAGRLGPTPDGATRTGATRTGATRGEECPLSPFPSMGRPHRPNIAGGVYHVMSRGIHKDPIYLDDHDRSKFLGILESVVMRFGWECLAYCLMDNHYHLIVRTPQPDLSRGMGLVNGRYATHFNR